YFENVKRTQQSAKADATRLPFADEYDVDYFALDCAYMKFIKESRPQQPDIIKHVDVQKNMYDGNYMVKWDLEAGTPGGSPMAHEFDVEIRYFSLPKTETFHVDSTDSYRSELVQQKKAYGTTTTFVTPAELDMESGRKY
ncbi:MAG: hypothetical protein J6P60_06935, partial [Lachnospiraceae bacterium]|nr:hypothetical protein [Lachnospiraceae bacterium]